MSETKRSSLIQDILELELKVIEMGNTNITYPSDPAFFDNFSSEELELMRGRFQALIDRFQN